MRSCTDVHNCLQEEGVAHEIIHLPALADTARRAADLLGVPLREVVKTLLFFLDTRPAIVLVPGDRQASPELIRQVSGCSEVVLARPFEVLQITGFRAGALPPCGLAVEIPTYADPEVFVLPVVFCGGGTTTTMLKMRSEELMRITQPLVAPLTEPSEPAMAEEAGQVEAAERPSKRGPTGRAAL